MEEIICLHAFLYGAAIRFFFSFFSFFWGGGLVALSIKVRYYIFNACFPVVIKFLLSAFFFRLIKFFHGGGQLHFCLLSSGNIYISHDKSSLDFCSYL